MEMLSNSKFGFGMMRLPRDESGEIDLPCTCKMVDDFIARGFTYFDTAYVYAGSEVAVKAALVDRYPRDAYTIASKLPGFGDTLKTPEDAERLFNETCTRLGVDYLDFYLMHNVSDDHGHIFDDMNCWEWAKQKKAEGKIRHLGFSSHGTPAYIEKLLTDHPEAEFVQLQLNYFDWENEQVKARECYEVVRKFGKPIIVMEPVRGGSLASLPAEQEAILKEKDLNASTASWALRYIASKEGIMTVLSGMSSEEQVKDNLNTFADFKPLTADETAMMDKIAEALRAIPTVPCTGCKYCVEGCPMQINIPTVFRALNQVRMFGDSPVAQTNYKRMMGDQGGKPADCIACGACMEACPQHLEIPTLMQEAASLFNK
jgi:hypothetical protein